VPAYPGRAGQPARRTGWHHPRVQYTIVTAACRLAKRSSQPHPQPPSSRFSWTEHGQPGGA
jgi:hypothetical protein